MEPLVSVIIPAYNRAHMLPRALESLLQQTHQNWEALIVDDASSDNTAEVMAQFVKKDARIHFFQQTKNGGACVARNVGIDHAKGTFVTFLDSDDEYYPRKIELQVQLLQQSSVPNVGVVSCGRHDARDGKVYFKWIPSKKGNIVNNLLRKERVGGNTSFLMVKKSVLDAHKLYFDPEMPAGQDWDFLLRVCQHANFDFVPEPLVIIHHHSGERVYTGERALIAIEKQYNKNKALLLQNKAIHDRFLMKMVVQNYTYGRADKAVDILTHKMLAPNFKTRIWQASIKTFPRYGNLPSRMVYKMLKSLL